MQFTSAVWAALCEKYGVKQQLTTGYHPQSNGMVERFHCQLKNSLRARGAGADWPAHLPWVLLGLQAATKKDSGISSAEMFNGVPLRLPGDPWAALDASLEEVVGHRAVLPAVIPLGPLSYAQALSGPPPLLAGCPMVMVKAGAKATPLSQPFAGP